MSHRMLMLIGSVLTLGVAAHAAEEQVPSSFAMALGYPQIPHDINSLDPYEPIEMDGGGSSISLMNVSMRDSVLSTLFVVGLFLVALEDFLGLNKAAVMLMLAASMWMYLAVSYHLNEAQSGDVRLHTELDRGLNNVGSVILFLLPAMGIIESIDHFDGFACVTAAIKRSMGSNRDRLLPIICFMTFVLSSLIDNLTSTIVALKILRHIAGEDVAFRRCCGGLAVVTANAGGAWSPIGDVTTSMLWISDKISVGSTTSWLFLPSFAAGFVPVAGVWWQLCGLRNSRGINMPVEDMQSNRGVRARPPHANADTDELKGTTDISIENSIHGGSRDGVVALVFGMGFILTVPLLKMLTGLPPYLGMLFSLGLFWLTTDTLGLRSSSSIYECDDEEGNSKPRHSGPPTGGVMEALGKVDLAGVFFFTGVLLSIGSLDCAGVLAKYATYLVSICGHHAVAVGTLLGVSSAFVDNVPLVEATIDMFSETPMDDPLWQLTALAAGTGGSILSVGSIAGVTLMSMEGVGFLWYLRNISAWALLGFAVGIVIYQAERLFFG